MFEDLLGNMEWAKAVLNTLEKSRNIVMHGGIVAKEDIERIGMNGTGLDSSSRLITVSKFRNSLLQNFGGAPDLMLLRARSPRVPHVGRECTTRDGSPSSACHEAVYNHASDPEYEFQK